MSMEDRLNEINQQVGEINGTIKAWTDTMERHMSQNEQMHRDHYQANKKNEVGIARINARHATYWKVIGSLGGLGSILAGWMKIGGGGGH